MADGILGLGAGQAASLNQDLIDKLKDAESKSTVAPIETDLLEIEAETLAVTGIKDKFNELLEAIKPFDLFITSGVNAFDAKVATTAGTAASFEAADESKLEVGTTTVTINSLATKDVYQSNTIADKTVITNADNNIVLDGELFSTTGEDFSALATAIDGSGTFTASYDSGADELTINGTVFSTAGKTYSDLVTDITTEGTFSASVDYIEIDGEIFSTAGEDFDALATAIDASGTFTSSYDADAKELTINGTVFSTSRSDYNDLAATIDAEGTFSTNGKYIKINDNVISTLGKTYTEIADDINSKTALNASLEEIATDTFRMVIKSAQPGLDNALNITESGFDLGFNQNTSTATVVGTDIPAGALTLTMNGTSFTTDGVEDYDTFIGRINTDPDFEASIDGNGNVLIRRADGTALDVTTDDLTLGLTNNNHTLSASNLSAVVDGIDYDVSSNEITVGEGLKITAVETGTSSITVGDDTLSLATLLQNVVTKYNELVELVEAETLQSDGTLQDKSSMNSIMTSIREKLFGSYGENADKNIFNYGFSIDKSGVLSLDNETFNTAVQDDLASLRTLFIGDAVNEGLGTQLKEYVDALDGFGGLITIYEDNMAERKTALEENKEKATTSLDSKYSLMAQQFASYSVIINQMENSFSGLKMMIEQSTSSG